MHRRSNAAVLLSHGLKAVRIILPFARSFLSFLGLLRAIVVWDRGEIFLCLTLLSTALAMPSDAACLARLVYYGQGRGRPRGVRVCWVSDGRQRARMGLGYVFGRLLLSGLHVPFHRTCSLCRPSAHRPGLPMTIRFLLGHGDTFDEIDKALPVALGWNR